MDWLSRIKPFRSGMITFMLSLAISVPAFAQQPVFNDVTRLNPTPVYKILKIQSLEDLKAAITEARSKKLQIAIAGKRHSQGGHQSCKNCIVLDMLGFNNIISVDKENKTIRVQPGATWEQIQKPS
jgi:decaprenylphospho-beta-D-ribofuranose 2-oxidase